MMAKQKTRLKKFTLKELRKMTKARLIRIILRLQLGRVGSAIKKARRTKRSSRTKRKRSRTKNSRKLSAGIHIIRMKNGQTRKVKVLANGQWRFLKNGNIKRRKTSKRSTRRRR